MNHLSQDSSVTSSEETHIQRESTALLPAKSVLVDSSLNTRAKYDDHDSSNNQSSVYKTFPWISEFSKSCQLEVGLTKIHTLENLMTEYLRNVTASVLECHLKPKRSAKLKKTMNTTLLLFHFFYSGIRKPLEHSSYLDKMSDLMAMYIDMEITASSRSKESLFKIASKLTSSLFILLDRSPDHILDAIFKTRYMNKNYWELCNLIFTRVLRESPGRTVCDLTYVRYVLAFKMWKRVVKGIEEKRNVMKLASMKLHPPPLFRESVKAGIFCGILPKIPKSRNDVTMFLMQAKFCIKEKIKAFLKQINSSEKRAALGSYISSYDSTFNSNDTDDSRVSSEEDQEDNRGGSAALINNIWASMSDESGVAHQIRMANIIKGKKLKSKLRKAKCKGIATPVFNTNPLCGESTDKMKKKRRPQEITELAAIKPLPASLPSDKTSNPTNITVVRPRIDPTIDTAVQVSETPPVIIIKNEPIETDVDVDVAKSSNQVSKRDIIYEDGTKGEPEATDMSKVVDSKLIKTDSSPSATVAWRDRVCDTGSQTPPCDPVFRTVDRLVPEALPPPKEECTQYQVLSRELTNQEITPQDITAAKSLINFSQSSQSARDPNQQDFIKETVTRIQDSGRGIYKNHVELPKTVVEQQDQNLKSDPDSNQEKCKEVLHDQTLRRDFMVFTSQHLFRSNLLNNRMPPDSSLPCPYESEGEKAAPRCACFQCAANQSALITNYKTLVQFLECKQNPAASEKAQDPDPTSCLPFKKRKTVSVEKEDEDQCNKTPSGEDMSYPGTPMMSIAEVVTMDTVPAGPGDPAIYPAKGDTPPNQSVANLVPANSFDVASPTIEQTVIPGTNMISVPSVNTPSLPETAFHSSHYKPKFKTPPPNPTVSYVVQSNSLSVPVTTEESTMVSANHIMSVSRVPTPDSKTPFHSSHFKPKFKTPAQLKECPVPRPAVDPSVAQNLNNSASSKRKSTPHSFSRSCLPQKESKPKVERNLRKRK